MKPGDKNYNDQEIRVLVADDDGVLADRMADFLRNNGFNARIARNGVEARSILLTWKPDYVIYDLLLPELNALQFLKYLGAEALGEDKIKVIVLSGHTNQSNIRECMRLGALDYLVKPFKYIDLLSRLVLHKQKKRTIEEPQAATADEAAYFLHLTDLTLREALKNTSLDETLFDLTRMVSMAAKAVRVSVVKCDFDNRKGDVLASSDLRYVKNLQLDLAKYPEILWALKSGKILALENLAGDPAMAFVAKQNKSIQFNSMIVAPIFLGGTQPWGVISARMNETKIKLSDSEIRFVQLVSHVIGLALLKDRNAATSIIDDLSAKKPA